MIISHVLIKIKWQKVEGRWIGILYVRLGITLQFSAQYQ